MRILPLFITFLTILFPYAANAYDVLVLQTRPDQSYEEVLKGFRSEHSFSERLLLLTDFNEVDVARIVREEQPRIIVTLGDKALALASSIKNMPVVALMTTTIRSLHNIHPNVTGIDIFTQPENYCTLMKSIKKYRVGMIYSRQKSGWYIQLARRAAELHGIELVTREVVDPRETPAKLESLSGKIDALWMLPDSTAVSRETSEAYFQFSQSQSIPLVSFASAYLNIGASIVIEIDRVAMGKQAASMALRVLKYVHDSKIPLETPKKTKIKANQKILQRLNIDIRQIKNIDDASFD